MLNFKIVIFDGAKVQLYFDINVLKLTEIV